MAKSEATLEQQYPDVASQWDFEKNPDDFTPGSVSPGSHKKAWFVCEKGHSWEASIKNRTKKGSGCPYCSGRRATDENNITVTFSEFAAAMDRYGEQKVTPTSLKETSRTKAHLKCALGHTWVASPFSYAGIKGDLCPYCSNREALPGYNDLATLRPDVAQLWDKEKNGFSADSVPLRNNRNGKEYNWKCSKGHTWKKNMSSALNHPGCPVCKGKSIVIGENDISVFAPDLYAELSDKHKNPDDLLKIFPHSNFKLTWVCPKGHGEYQSSMAKRSAGRGCPVCAGNTLTKVYQRS